MAMEDEDLQSNPSYRFGVIMGRMHTLTDIMALFAQGDAEEGDLPGILQDMAERQSAIGRWMDQARAECDAEAAMLHQELLDEEGGATDQP